MAKHCEECKAYPLRAIPPDVYDIIIDKQAKEKKRRTQNRTIERVIYEIIREYSILVKSEPVVVVRNDDFYVMREVTNNERTHIYNAVNKKVKK